MKLFKLAVVLLAACCSNSLLASEWVIDSNQSELNFISIKKTHIAEVHQFTQLTGELNSEGKFTFNIDLASVDTHNPVRDIRMKEFLFDIASFPSATVTSTIDVEDILSIAEGASARLTVDATLELHGQTKPLVLDVIVTRLVGAKLSVTSTKPVILNVGDFALMDGIEKLRDLAKLPSISKTVLVSFYITLNLKK